MPLKDYIGDNEELLLTWGGKPGKDDDFFPTSRSSVEFGATNKRLILVDGSRTFKDIEYTHISSIESEKDKDVKNIADFDENGLLLGGIGAVASIGGIGVEVMPLLLTGIALIVIAMFMNMEEVQKVRVITGDEAASKVNFKTTDNISGELSRIIRENS